VPLVIGGRSDAALRRTARHGDGWLGVWCSPRRYAQVLAAIAAEAGDRDVRWRHGLQVWVGIDDDRARARERLAARMQAMYRVPFERFEKYSPFGTPAEIADFLAPYVEAGCASFNVMAVADGSERGVDGVAEIRARLS
jgi:alkanesulfonate monooxygenase SsuD/methylene tetrahydromethanopterin reductase-like flavin-dependent oxidoreductase (luciferase family)